MNRILCLLVGLMAALPVEVLAQFRSTEVTLEFVAEKAEARAHKPFHSPRGDLPDILKADKLDYDKYREIEFRHEKALWSADNLPFRAEFFHPGNGRFYQYFISRNVHRRRKSIV